MIRFYILLIDYGRQVYYWKMTENIRKHFWCGVVCRNRRGKRKSISRKEKEEEEQEEEQEVEEEE